MAGDGRMNATQNKCTGLGNYNEKGKEWISWWRVCARKSLGTSLFAYSEISQSRAKFVPFLFSAFVVAKARLQRKVGCVMDR